jgi:hypothetical protein
MVISGKRGQSVSEFIIVLGILTLLGSILAYYFSPKTGGGLAGVAQQNTTNKIVAD